MHIAILPLKFFRLFLVLFVLNITFCNAQKFTANIENFGLEEGLSHHDVRDVAVDARGLVWVGTRNGLNRFDGKKFKSFYKEDGLLDNNIEYLFADGEILVCIHRSRTIEAIESITLFHSVTEQRIDFNKWSGLKDVDISQISMVEGNDNEIVFGIKKEDGPEATYYLKKPNKPAVKLNIDVPAFFIASCQDGTFWFHEWKHDRLTKRDIKGKILRIVKTQFLKTWPEEFNVDMRFNEHNKWLYEYDSLYQIKGDRLWHVKTPNKQNKTVQLPSEFARNQPFTNLLWYSENSSNYLIDSAGNIEFSYIMKDRYVNNTDKFINNVVLQPTSNGLNIISLYPSSFENYNAGDKGAFRGISKIGDEYVVTNILGVHTISKDFTKYSKFISYVGNTAVSANDFIYTVGRHSINKIDKYNNLIWTHHLPYAHEVWGMQAEDSLLYYSTFGLHQYNLKTQKDLFIKSENYPEINEATIYAIQAKSEQEFWLCSTKGLFFWNKNTALFTKVINDVEGVSDFRHLYKIGNTLWIASGGKGLVKHNLANHTTQHFSFGHKGTNIVHSVYPDQHDNLWMSTDHGIVRFNVKTEQFLVFHESDGLVNNEFNRISHFKDADGSLVFGGIKGLVRFHPDSMADMAVDKVKLTPFIVDAWLYKEGGSKISEITTEFNKDHSITIEPQDRFLSFDLATNSIEYYDKVIFSYKMDEDETWKILPNNRLEFNILPFGTHNISVQATLPNKYVSNNKMSFAINVVKPVYLRIWFIMAVVFGLFFAAIVAVIIRTRRLEKQKKILELEVKKRTKKILKDKELIEQQSKDLQSLDKMKNRFFANISHELRNPLTLILGPVENLLSQENIKLPSLVQSQMGLTLKNAQSLQKRINEILALSKIDAGKLTLTYSAIHAKKFFNRLILAHLSFAKSKEINIQFVNKLSTKLNLKLDTDNIEKVVNNLLSNAIKYSPKHTAIKVTLDKDKSNTYRLTVKDQGEGIVLGDEQKIFDRYYQSKKGKKAGGTGLGLALSQELAQLMGGNIIVENIAEGGALFSFTFKAKTTNEAVEEHELEEPIDTHNETDDISLPAPTTEVNVLVVDDNEEMRSYIKSILSGKCKVFEAENGKVALDMLRKRKIDLVTSDLMMPVMDGMEFLQKHRETKNANIPVIMVTARADEADKLSAWEIGIDDYITKPFYARELMARVNNLLNLKKLREEAILEEEDLEDNTSTEGEIQIQKVIEVIKEQLHNNKFSVAELAEKIGISERQLRRIIKKEKGVTPIKLIKELRLNKARTYFETERFSTIAEVMNACGFKSSGHFTTGYFERFGKKPIEYFE